MNCIYYLKFDCLNQSCATYNPNVSYLQESKPNPSQWGQNSRDSIGSSIAGSDDDDVFTCNNNLFHSDDLDHKSDIINHSRDGPVNVQGRPSLGAPSKNAHIKRSKLPKRSTSYDNLTKIKNQDKVSNHRALSDGNIRERVAEVKKINAETYTVKKELGM